MTTALGTFVPGHYAATWNGVALGLVTLDGHSLRVTLQGEPIDDTSAHGKSLIDGIFQGEKVELVCTFREWNSTIRTLLWPYSSAGFDGIAGVVGQLQSAEAQALVLTAQATSPAAAANSPATITFHAAAPAMNNEMQILMAPKARDIPFKFDILKTEVSSVLRYWTMT